MLFMIECKPKETRVFSGYTLTFGSILGPVPPWNILKPQRAGASFEPIPSANKWIP